MLRGVWTLAVLAVLTLVFSLAAAVVSLFRRQSDVTVRLGKLWSLEPPGVDAAEVALQVGTR